MNQIKLLIPQLFTPLLLWHKDFGFSAESHVLSNLLSNSQKQKTTSHCLTSALFKQLGFSPEKELPIAYYRYLLDFGKHPNSSIMCADPVNLQAGIDEIILNPEPIDDLSKTDSEELLKGLNKHFAQGNWEFIVADSGNWYLSHQSDEVIQTNPIDLVRGKSIFQYLPKSETLNWHSLQNEIQMLLHMNPLNQSREIAGQNPVNSLWFWGAGKASSHQHDFDTIWGGDIIGATAALAGELKHQAIPKMINDLPNGNHLFILDDLFFDAVQDKYNNWQDTLLRLETDYIEPIAKICKKKNIQLQLDTCDGQTFQINQQSSWKFWKKDKVDLLRLS